MYQMELANSNEAPGNTVSVISTTLTPTQAIQQLINTIDSFHLPKGVTTSLEAPLNAALAQLKSGRQDYHRN